MYLSTLNANKNMANKQIMAATNVPLKTLQPNRNIITYNPFDRLAQNAKAESNSVGERVGNAYSDPNKQMAAKLEMFNKGEKAAAGFREKGTELYNKGIQAQSDADYKTSTNNRAINDFNIASIKAGVNKANLVEANKLNADNTAFTALTHGTLKNLQNRKNEKDYSGLVNMQIGDEYKGLRNESKLYDETALAKAAADYKVIYDKAKAEGKDIKEWNMSDQYNELLKGREQFGTKMEN